MFNSLNRLQSVFGFFTTVVFTLGAFIFATDLYAERTPTGVIRPTNTQVVKGRPHYYSSKKEEYAVVKFSLDADLSSLFTWNTKQVFVYVTLNWSDKTSTDKGVAAANEAVIWDTIITSPSSDHLSNIGPASLRKLKKSAEGRSIAPERGLIKLKNQKPKYQVTYPSGKIGDTEDVQLQIHYSVQPWFGLLTFDTVGDFGYWKSFTKGVSERFNLPPVKTKDDKKKAATDKAKKP